MNAKALRILEFDKILARLEAEADSVPGRNLCRSLKPADSLSQILLRREQTQDAVSRLLSGPNSPSFGNNRDFSLQLSRLSIGGVLQAGELLALASFLENVARVKAFGRSAGPDLQEVSDEDVKTDSLSGFFEELMPLTPSAAEIRRCILSEEEIADDATPAIRQIRRQMSSLQDKIHNHLSSLVNGSARTYLMDPVITQKNGRYCIPVKAEHKASIPGIVHERSGSGSTLFIEPSAIVDFNNKIRELQQEEKEEIEKLLALLSADLSDQVEALKRNCELMTMLDFIFAKAALALSMKASCPDFSEDGQMHIKKGRHPLLPQDRVVPIDVQLSSDIRQMIITGPNTGGKTVSLKTIGLFCLMAQAGLFIPALDHSILPVFKKIYADIGDEQSIEQNLSTFSSHMTNIVDILKQAAPGTLCLFDELCSGTDPDEGASLAISILEKLHKRGALCIATTHYSEIKMYALQTPGVINACCEFDVASLMPTYRLLIGIPGKSNAFAISKRLGLSDDIIDSARKRMSRDQEQFEDVLSQLEHKRITMEEQTLQISLQDEEIKRRLEDLEKREKSLEKQKEHILQQANEQARDILQNAKEVADDTIRSFRKYGENTSMREMEQQRSALREKINDRNAALSAGEKKTRSREGQKPDPATIAPGDPVKVLSMNLEGHVSSKPDPKGYLFVTCGVIRSKVHIDDLIMIAEETANVKPAGKSSVGRIAMNKARNVPMELNLLGRTTDEAVNELDKYLDDAYMAHIPMVRIVHGKGTGALRKAVHDHLRRQKHVKEYRLGEFGEGDAGVTIVTFK
ncbi:MAG: endonuclease MutS2 [Lachnospiraceae bacterium]|nr:endonuclease MutS2 [Lachnospiraceae bacterium]